jgi:hypothetical protein
MTYSMETIGWLDLGIKDKALAVWPDAYANAQVIQHFKLHHHRHQHHYHHHQHRRNLFRYQHQHHLYHHNQHHHQHERNFNLICKLMQLSFLFMFGTKILIHLVELLISSLGLVGSYR